VKIPGGFDALFRQATPLVLLGVLLVVVFDWVPGGDWLRAQFGDGIVLRLCVAVLACYVLILWGEALRLHTMLGGVLQAFRRFDQERAAGGEPAPAKNPKARLEAARLLIAAMRSDDASIRSTSRHNLMRLVGQDLGADPAAWQRWLQQQEAGGAR
jgi:hypothetical protein